MMTFPGSLYWLTPWESSVHRSSICCLRRPRGKAVLTHSLSGLRRGPHSALLDTGRLTPSCARGRYFLLADLLLLVRRTIDFAAQSNLAFLGMWIELNRVYQPPQRDEPAQTRFWHLVLPQGCCMEPRQSRPGSICPQWRDPAYGPGRPHFRIKIKDCLVKLH